jgi:hypothetical protein
VSGPPNLDTRNGRALRDALASILGEARAAAALTEALRASSMEEVPARPAAVRSLASGALVVALSKITAPKEATAVREALEGVLDRIEELHRAERDAKATKRELPRIGAADRALVVLGPDRADDLDRIRAAIGSEIDVRTGTGGGDLRGWARSGRTRVVLVLGPDRTWTGDVRLPEEWKLVDAPSAIPIDGDGDSLLARIQSALAQTRR